MTKRDYILLAGIIKSVGEDGALCMDSANDRVYMAEEFANALAKENPRFDRLRFLQASTLEGDITEAAEERECEPHQIVNGNY